MSQHLRYTLVILVSNVALLALLPYWISAITALVVSLVLGPRPLAAFVWAFVGTALGWLLPILWQESGHSTRIVDLMSGLAGGLEPIWIYLVVAILSGLGGALAGWLGAIVKS